MNYDVLVKLLSATCFQIECLQPFCLVQSSLLNKKFEVDDSKIIYTKFSLVDKFEEKESLLMTNLPMLLHCFKKWSFARQI